MNPLQNTACGLKIVPAVRDAIVAIPGSAGDFMGRIAVMALSYASDAEEVTIAVGVISTSAQMLLSEIHGIREHVENAIPPVLGDQSFYVAERLLSPYASTVKNALYDLIGIIRKAYS